MRRTQTLSLLTFCLLSLQATACYSFRPLDQELPSRWEQGMDAPIVRVTMTNGREMKLTHVAEDSIALHGETLGGLSGVRRVVAIPREEVQRIEHRRIGPVKTGSLVGGFLIAAVGALALALGSAI